MAFTKSPNIRDGSTNFYFVMNLVDLILHLNCAHILQGRIRKVWNLSSQKTGHFVTQFHFARLKASTLVHTL